MRVVLKQDLIPICAFALLPITMQSPVVPAAFIDAVRYMDPSISGICCDGRGNAVRLTIVKTETLGFDIVPTGDFTKTFFRLYSCDEKQSQHFFSVSNEELSNCGITPLELCDKLNRFCTYRHNSKDVRYAYLRTRIYKYNNNQQYIVDDFIAMMLNEKSDLYSITGIKICTPAVNLLNMEYFTDPALQKMSEEFCQWWWDSMPHMDAHLGDSDKSFVDNKRLRDFDHTSSNEYKKQKQ